MRRLPALCGFWNPAASGPPLRLPASLYLPAFRPLPAPDEPKARGHPKGSSCCRYCFVGHRIGMPGNNNFIIERVEHWRELHQQRLKNGIIFALPRSNILRFWSSLISTRNPWGTISISRFASICASRAMVLILVASSPSSVADFFFSSAVFSFTSRAFLRLFRHRHGGRFWRMRRADLFNGDSPPPLKSTARAARR